MRNSRRERGLSTPQVSCEERNEEEENDEKPHGGSRDRRAKEESERERERAGEGRRRSGIHFEIASHPVRSPFFAASSSRHPPVAFSRLLPSGKATPPARFSPSFSLTLSFYLTLSGSLPFGEAACSPRILISSKVLFPLNRAATRNNALYVRVLRLSFLPPRPSSSLFSSSPVSELQFRAALTSPSLASSFRHASELAMYSNLFRRGPYIFNSSAYPAIGT